MTIEGMPRRAPAAPAFELALRYPVSCSRRPTRVDYVIDMADDDGEPPGVGPFGVAAILLEDDHTV
jgi:hypothetical protein